MFGLFKNKRSLLESRNYYPINSDMHSHILPGIDDGSPNIETSLLLVKGMKDMGITKATATPHIISDLYRNTPETIGDALAKLRAALAAEQIDFEVNAAAEYMLDSYFFEMLTAGKQMLPITENILLTEFSYSSMPSNPEQMAFAIQTEGYVPILAHPERYAYYHNNFKMYDHLSELGFLLQVNLLSLTGYYGKETAKAARYIIKNDLIKYAGTDMHHERHLSALSDVRNKRMFAEVFEGVQLQNHFL